MNKINITIIIWVTGIGFCLAQEWVFTYDASGNRTQRVYSTAPCAPDEQQSGKKGDDEDENSSYGNTQNNQSSENVNGGNDKSKGGHNEKNEPSGSGKNISINPNPSKGRFTVQSPEINISSITVYNVLGEIIYQSTNQPVHQSTIDFSLQPKGIYMVRIISGKEIYAERIAIE